MKRKAKSSRKTTKRATVKRKKKKSRCADGCCWLD